MPALDRATLSEALDLAATAPSPHNTQPWRVRVRGAVSGDSRVDVFADASRHLAHTDPGERDLRVALSAFVEALQLALRSRGWTGEVLPASGGAFASLRLLPLAAGGAELVSLLRRRHTSRLPYSPRPAPLEAVQAMSAAAAARGCVLHVFDRGSADFERLKGWLHAASREAWLDPRATAELARWIHLDPEGLRRPADGLSTFALGLSNREALGLMAVLRPGVWRALGAVHAAPWLAGALAQADVDSLQQAPQLGVLVADEAGAAGGEAVLHTWLEAERHHLAMHPLSVLLDRRGWEVAKHLGVDARRLRLAFRLGASVPVGRAGRRPGREFVEFG